MQHILYIKYTFFFFFNLNILLCNMTFEKEQAETVKHMEWVLKRQAIMMGGDELIMSLLQICGYEDNGRVTHGPVR